MKKLIYFIGLYLLSVNLIIAQAPQGFSYQGVVKDELGEIISNQDIELKIAILEYATNGNIVYVENHTVTTSINGLFSIVIGSGNQELGEFELINWGNSNHYIKIQIDETFVKI